MARWDLLFDYTLLITIPVTFFYCFILFIVIKSKHKSVKSTYFRIFVVTGIFDVQLCIALQYLIFCEHIGIGPDQEFPQRIARFMTGSHYFSHLFGNLFMAFYQLTMVSWPFRILKYWKTKSQVGILIAVLIYCVGAYAPILPIPLTFEEVSPEFWVYTGRSENIAIVRTLSSATAAITQLLTVVFIVATALKITVDKKKTSPLNRKKSYHLATEQKHLLFTAANLVLFFFVALFDFTFLMKWNLKCNIFLSFIGNNLLIITFAIMVINGPMMLFTSRIVRKEFVAIFKKPDGTQVYSLNPTNNFESQP